MLHGIDARIDADLLHALRAMGHGDRIALVDINFPTASMAAQTVVGRPLSLPVACLADAVELITSLMPLDQMEADFAQSMAVVGDPEAVPEVLAEVARGLVEKGEARPVQALDRFAFYEAAKQAYAVVQILEPRAYGNIILTKGVLIPDG